MKIVEFIGQTELKVKNIKGFMKRKVVVSGTSAKINVPKGYLGCETYLVILENEHKKRGKKDKGRVNTDTKSIRKSSSKDRRAREKRSRERQDNPRTKPNNQRY